MIGYVAIGHITEKAVIATEFREGNQSPSSKNLEFIQCCEKSMPEGVRITQRVSR